MICIHHELMYRMSNTFGYYARHNIFKVLWGIAIVIAFLPVILGIWGGGR